MRQDLTQFIPTQPQQFFNDNKAGRVQSLINSLGNITFNIANQQAQESNAEIQRNQAIAKLRTLSGEANSNLQLAKRKAEKNTTEQQLKTIESNIKFLVDAEDSLVFSAVNGLDPEELRNVSASNLGFRSPEAIEKVNRGIGERLAGNDLSRLQGIIATDLSKPASQHVQDFIKNNAPQDSLESQIAYAKEITDRIRTDLSARQRENIKNLAEDVVAQSADSLSFELSRKMGAISREGFLKAVDKFEASVLSVQNISREEVQDLVVATINPLFLGNQAVVKPQEGLAILGRFFTDNNGNINFDELEASGMAPTFRELQNIVVERTGAAIKKEIDARLKAIDESPTHEAARAEANELLSVSPDNITKNLAERAITKRLEKPDYGQDVVAQLAAANITPQEAGKRTDGLGSAAGDIVTADIPITEQHDPAINTYVNNQKALKGDLFTVDDAFKIYTDLKRIPKQVVDGINSQIDSGDPFIVRDGLNKINLLKEQSPALYEANRDKFSEKGRAIADIVSLVPGSENLDDPNAPITRLLERLAPIPNSSFIVMKEIVDSGKDVVNTRLTKELNKQNGLFSFIFGRGSIVIDSATTELYDSLIVKEMAIIQSRSGALTDANNLLKNASAVAVKELTRDAIPVKMGDHIYVIPSRLRRSIGFSLADDNYIGRVGEKWSIESHTLKRSYTTSAGREIDPALDFSRAEIINENGIKTVVVPVLDLPSAAPNIVFKFPLDDGSVLAKQLAILNAGIVEGGENLTIEQIDKIGRETRFSNKFINNIDEVEKTFGVKLIGGSGSIPRGGEER